MKTRDEIVRGRKVVCQQRKQELINELSRLYVLQNEGKKVRTLIQELEEKLIGICDDEIDLEKRG